jgi:heme/copper-type cytochrome/quinol oxidase subunit 2
MHCPLRPVRRIGVVLAVVAAVMLAAGLVLMDTAGRVPAVAAAGSRQEPEPGRREFTVTARKYAFSPSRIEVRQDDLVKITFTTDDIPHSFTIDEYRIAKRAGPGQTIVFEFRADQPGTFRFYCNLTVDDRCREMRGEFVVRAR